MSSQRTERPSECVPGYQHFLALLLSGDGGTIVTFCISGIFAIRKKWPLVCKLKVGLLQLWREATVAECSASFGVLRPLPPARARLRCLRACSLSRLPSDAASPPSPTRRPRPAHRALCCARARVRLRPLPLLLLAACLLLLWLRCLALPARCALPAARSCPPARSPPLYYPLPSTLARAAPSRVARSRS